MSLAGVCFANRQPPTTVTLIPLESWGDQHRLLLLVSVQGQPDRETRRAPAVLAQHKLNRL